MSVRTAQKVLLISGLALSVSLLFASNLDPDPTGFSTFRAVLFALAGAGTLVLAAFAYRFLRCPKCGHALSKKDYLRLKCSQCGEVF